RAREPLDETGCTERGRAVRRGDGEAREPEQEEPSHHGALGPEPRRCQAAGDAAEERARAEGADEETGARLREVELLRVARDEWRQRGEEHRVDEDDRADESEQAPHCRARYGNALHTKMQRAGGGFGVP